MRHRFMDASRPQNRRFAVNVESGEPPGGESSKVLLVEEQVERSFEPRLIDSLEDPVAKERRGRVLLSGISNLRD